MKKHRSRRDKNPSNRTGGADPPGRRSLSWFILALCLSVLTVCAGLWIRKSQRPGTPVPPLSTAAVPTAAVPTAAPGPAARGQESAAGPVISRPRDTMQSVTVREGQLGQVSVFWQAVPAELQKTRLRPAVQSNIRRVDYAGAEACKECHKEKYEAWSRHSHRWMNALATDQTVKGDFSGVKISYLRGEATFYREANLNRLRLARDGVQRIFVISRTLGSRYFQYFIGKLVEGPEPKTNALWTVDHLLPFGYWIDEKEWVPIVHVSLELPDGQRVDPFVTPSEDPYDQQCASCHTTRPMGDWMLSATAKDRLKFYSPHKMAFDALGYLNEVHPTLLSSRSTTLAESDIADVEAAVNALPAVEYAVNLGISCEACHNGGGEHIRRSRTESSELLPHFFPASPYVYVQGLDSNRVWGRHPHNSNWICARCHSGARPHFANGIATWNSTEFSDAEFGYCYGTRGKPPAGMPTLTCVHCHDPHKPIGKKWTPTPAADDGKCIACHQQFESAADRVRHTHHQAGSAGSHCMDCHMPRINEGLQDVVRTHTIFSPSHPRMIEANQPNACNLCHLDKPIDWTVLYLRRWYRISRHSYAAEKLAANYPNREGPVGLGWLKSPHESTRLVAVDALTKAKVAWALPALIEALDDPYLLNRQFDQKGLQDMLGVRLAEYGYRFYMTPDERRAPIQRLRAELPRIAATKLGAH